MRLELGEGLLDVDLLLLEVGDLVVDLVEGELQVGGRHFAAALFRDHRADLGEGEPELLALQDDGKAGAVTGIVDSSGTVAAGREGRDPRRT